MEYQTDKEISKMLSYLLRHCTEPLYIDLTVVNYIFLRTEFGYLGIYLGGI